MGIALGALWGYRARSAPLPSKEVRPLLNASESELEQLLPALHSGGCVIYIRHAHTDRSRDDALTPDRKDCATQRLLSREGEKQADELGLAIRESGLPVGLIYCSPYCRALETARRAFPHHRITEVPELARLARVARNKVPACRAALKDLLNHSPAPDENTFLVSHSWQSAGLSWMKKAGQSFAPERTVIDCSDDSIHPNGRSWLAPLLANGGSVFGIAIPSRPKVLGGSEAPMGRTFPPGRLIA